MLEKGYMPWWLAGCGLVLAIGALVVALRVYWAAGVTEIAIQDSDELATAVIDMGEFYRGEHRRASIRIRNMTSDHLWLSPVQSCSCVDLELVPAVVAPGGTTQVNLSYDSWSSPKLAGDLAESAMILDGRDLETRRPVVRVQARGLMKPSVVLQPARLKWVAYDSEGGKDTRRVKVRNSTGKPVVLRRSQEASGAFRAGRAELRLSPGEESWIPVTCDKSVVAGVAKSELIYTGTLEGGTALKIAIELEAVRTSAVSAIPGSLVLGRESPQKCTIHLVSRTDEEPRITNITCEDSLLYVEKITPVSFAVHVRAVGEDQLVNCVIRVEYETGGSGGELDIPVAGMILATGGSSEGSGADGSGRKAATTIQR